VSGGPAENAGRSSRWRTPALLGIVVAVAGVAGWFGLRPPPPTAPLVATRLLPAPIAVVPGVYLLGLSEPGAAYLVDTADGLVLIDSGLEAAVITDQLAALNLDVHRLRAVLLTHVHGDHSLGADQLRRQTGAKVYAGRDDCPPLRDGAPRVAFFSIYPMDGVPVHTTAVDEELAGGEALTFGDARFTVIATPGHTPGSVCYLLERPGLRALFTGDVVQHLSADAGTLGTYTAHLPPRYRGDATAYLESLRQLRSLPAPDLVLPGHPRMDAVPESPCLTPERWHGLLDRGIAEMERLTARYTADGADFLDGGRKELLPGLHYLGDCDDTAVYALDTPKGLLLFDAPAGPALVEYLEKRFRKLGWAGRKPAAVLLTSADEAATAGLAALVQRTGCTVMVAPAGLAQVRQRCPAGTTVVSTDDLPRRGWFAGQAIPLGGRGLAPVAYQIQWAGKTVLVSGRIPVKLNRPSADRLLRDVGGPGGNAARYVQALRRLAQIKPDLWLPAEPVHGQNANVYDDEWRNVLGQNLQLFPWESRPAALGR
jgi:glyoxylase-like metal-dependent hydrolase (beta-lactamase superfamily II)